METTESLAFRSEAEIRELVTAFETTTLPHALWTHTAHLTVAFWYVFHYETETATRRMRDGIKRYNAANGLETTPTGGYHETITLFWMAMLARYLAASDRTRGLLALTNAMRDCFSDKRLPLSCYSRERLLSAEARKHWLEPDLRSLDALFSIADGPAPVD